MSAQIQDSPFCLTGRRALVTGSSQGLGLAMARGLANAGAHVILNGRDQGKLAKSEAAFRDDGLEVSTASFDVTDEAAVKAAIAGIGAIDILINNAGIHRRAPLEELSTEDWEAVVHTNLTSAFVVGREVARGMIEQKSGKIINICSVMSEVTRPTIGNYAAAKGGLKMLTRAMAVEWGPHNIQANGIGPGYMLTELNKPLVENLEFDAWIRGRTPLRRWGKPEELAGTTVFLASSASDFMTGQVLYVDGGVLAAL